MDQFNLKLGCYANLDSSYKFEMPYLPWLVNSRNDVSAFSESAKGIEYLKNLNNIKKEKTISVICSNKAYTDDHKARLNFVYKLKEHFQNDLDWFGTGFQEIETKWEGIALKGSEEHGDGYACRFEKLRQAHTAVAATLYDVFARNR